jgi:hypothetical protein
VQEKVGTFVQEKVGTFVHPARRRDTDEYDHNA